MFKKTVEHLAITIYDLGCDAMNDQEPPHTSNPMPGTAPEIPLPPSMAGRVSERTNDDGTSCKLFPEMIDEISVLAWSCLPDGALEEQQPEVKPDEPPQCAVGITHARAGRGHRWPR